MGFYSNGYGAPVPEVLTAPVAYHAIVASVVLAVRCVACLLPLEKVGLAPPYLGQVGRMTADSPMLVFGWAQSRRVDHVVGPAVRGRRDVAARSTRGREEPPHRPSTDSSSCGETIAPFVLKSVVGNPDR
ncbi:hypothetical protein BHM03_00021368 [Ensete ventricosum]|nr:hypothetical protein BHM03_00021368 [Ensete ventricosum]